MCECTACPAAPIASPCCLHFRTRSVCCQVKMQHSTPTRRAQTLCQLHWRENCIGFKIIHSKINQFHVHLHVVQFHVAIVRCSQQELRIGWETERSDRHSVTWKKMWIFEEEKSFLLPSKVWTNLLEATSKILMIPSMAPLAMYFSSGLYKWRCYFALQLIIILIFT